MAEKKILVVDDEKNLITMVKDFFEDAGYIVSAAQDSEKALLELTAIGFELVILDMRMPGIDGIEMLKIINQRHPETKVIVLTGYSDEYKQKVINLKHDAFLTKPFSARDLIETANEILEGEKLRANELLYDDPYIMPKAKLLFIEANELSFGGKKMYFTQQERSGGEYTVDVIIDVKRINDKLNRFKPDIVLADIEILASEKDLQSKIMWAKNGPKDIVLYGRSEVAEQEEKVVEGTFDPLTAIFAKDVMDKLGKVVRETAIRNCLYVKRETEVHIPGINVEEGQIKTTDAPETPKKENFTLDEIKQLVIRCAAEQKEVSEESITENTNLKRDMDINLYDIIKIALMLEEELGIEIPDSESDVLYRKVKDIVKYLKRKMGERITS
ncbi:MAG: response regulator [Candidatus Omnitrophota bacterium]